MTPDRAALIVQEHLRSRFGMLLQSRPETVWSARISAPVSQPVDNPMAHLMNIFGGRK